MPRRSPKWKAVRRAHLEKEGWCRFCGSRSDLEVHHIEPYHLVPWKELDPQNLITLCESLNYNCHLQVGHFGDWRGYNRDVRQMAQAKQPATASR